MDWTDSDHPRGKGGKFAPKAGGGSTGGGSTEAPRERRQRRSPEERAAAAREREARAKARDEQRRAREAAREEKRKALADLRRSRERAREEKRKAVEARKAERVERAKQKAAREAARAEKRDERERRRAEKLEAARAVAAPVLPSGEVDASRVPGAFRGFKPPTTIDPDEGYKGRSYYSRTVKEQLDEFLGAASTGGHGINDLAVEHGVGAGRVGEGGGTWDAVRERYGVEVSSFEEAFKACAGGPPRRGSSKRDWRSFDLETLRECDGESFRHLQLPQWLHDAANHREEQQHLEDYYRDEYGGHVGYYRLSTGSQAEIPF